MQRSGVGTGNGLDGDGLLTATIDLARSFSFNIHAADDSLRGSPVHAFERAGAAAATPSDPRQGYASAGRPAHSLIRWSLVVYTPMRLLRRPQLFVHPEVIFEAKIGDFQAPPCGVSESEMEQP